MFPVTLLNMDQLESLDSIRLLLRLVQDSVSNGAGSGSGRGSDSDSYQEPIPEGRSISSKSYAYSVGSLLQAEFYCIGSIKGSYFLLVDDFATQQLGSQSQSTINQRS